MAERLENFDKRPIITHEKFTANKTYCDRCKKTGSKMRFLNEPTRFETGRKVFFVINQIL
uniref:Uncharacterized protein n=1 Tax=Romanomermis culicivorax TaxID=13658 RepID=A0A915IBA0_ROMCU